MPTITDASILSQVRIDISTLTGDIRKVETLYDNMEGDIQASLQKSESHIKGVAEVSKKGAITQEEAVKRIIKIRKNELELIKKATIEKGSATDEQVKDIKKLENQIKKLEATQEGATDTTSEQSDSLRDLAVGAGLVTIAVTAAKKAIDIFATTEQSLANVRAVTGSTADEFKKIEEAALKAGETTRFTASQSADALFYLASAGLSATESTEALGTTLELAGATGSDLAFTARTLTATMSQYNIEARDASRISNVFAAANANSQATLEKLTGAMRQVGSVAGLMGISVEETVGSLQLLFNAGFQGEAAGRALKSALADLGNQSSITNTKLADLGIAFESVNPATVGLTGAIAALEENNITAAQSLDIFGKVAGPQIATLINQGREEIEKYTEAVTDTNQAAEQYAIQNDTVAGSIDKFKSAVEGAAIKTTKDFAPAIKGVLGLLTGFFNTISKLPSSLRALVTGAGGATVAFVGLSKILTVIGVTLSTGPLAIVAGLGAVIGLMSVFVTKSSEIKQQRLQDEFGELGEELGKTGAALEEFVVQADKVINTLELFAATDTTGGILKNVTDTARQYGITRLEVIEIGIEAKALGGEYDEQLITLKNQIIAMENQALASQNLTKREKARKQAELDIERNIAEFKAKAAQKQADLIAAQVDRESRLLEIKDKITTLDDLARRGAVSEVDLLNKKKALRQEEINLLIEQAVTSGDTSDKTIQDIANQQASIDRYIARLAELSKQVKDQAAEETKVVITDGKKKADFLKKQAEDNIKSKEAESKRIKNTLDSRYDYQEKEEKDLVKDLEKNWKGYVSTIAKLTTDLINSLSDLKVAEANRDIAEIERVSEARIEAYEADLKALEDRSDDARNLLEKDTDFKLDAIDKETEALLEARGLQDETVLESLNNQLTAAIESGNLEKAAELEREIEKTKILENAEIKRAEIRERAAEEEKALLDASKDYNFTVIDELISAARTAGDTETADRLQDEKDRLGNIKTLNDEETAETKRVANRTAKIKYDADIAAWESSKTTAAFNGGQAAISAYTALAAIPIVGPGLGIAATAAAVALTKKNISKIDAAKPVLQKFETGGIVLKQPGVSVKGDNTQILANPKEMMLNEQQQKSLFDFINSGANGDQGGTFTIQMFEDGRKTAETSAKYYNNGIVKINRSRI